LEVDMSKAGDGKRSPVHARARTRVAKNGDVFMAFDDVLKLPPEQREAELMRHLWDIYWDARDRSYINKHGDTVPNPDGATVMRVVEVLQASWVTVGEKQQRRANLLELSMFKTERKAG